MSFTTTTTIKPVYIQIFPDGRLDVKNAALYLGYKEKTLAMKRSNGTGPRFIKRGRIFYFKEDLDTWVSANGRQLSTAQGLKRQVIIVDNEMQD